MKLIRMQRKDERYKCSSVCFVASTFFRKVPSRCNLSKSDSREAPTKKMFCLSRTTTIWIVTF